MKYNTIEQVEMLKKKMYRVNDVYSLQFLEKYNPILQDFERKYFYHKKYIPFDQNKIFQVIIEYITGLEKLAIESNQNITLFNNFHSLIQLNQNSRWSEKSYDDQIKLILNSYLHHQFMDDFSSYKKAYHLSDYKIHYDQNNIQYKDNQLIKNTVISLVSKTGFGYSSMCNPNKSSTC